MVAQTKAMHQMRQKGATLQQIASTFGISREEVRRQLTRHYGSTRIQDLLTAAELAHLAGCSYGYIDKLKRRGIIQPARVVGGRTLWQPETVATITSYIDCHRCPVCQQPVPSNRSVYCSEACYIEASRYKNRPEAVRKRQQEATARWRANHPEQAREIDQRKAKKYQAKKSAERYQNTQYVIWRRCLIPLGTVVRVLGLSRGKVRVEWGQQVAEVPFGCVRRVGY